MSNSKIIHGMFTNVTINDDLRALNEVGIIADKKHGFSIHTTASESRSNGQDAAYFKWVDSTSFSKAKHVARIKINSCEYVKHKDPNGKQPIFLNNKQKSQLIDAFNKKITTKTKSQIGNEQLSMLITTGWGYLLYRHNIRLGHSSKFILDNFYKMPYDESLPLNFVSMQTEMPDYTKLP